MERHLVCVYTVDSKSSENTGGVRKELHTPRRLSNALSLKQSVGGLFPRAIFVSSVVLPRSSVCLSFPHRPLSIGKVWSSISVSDFVTGVMCLTKRGLYVGCLMSHQHAFVSQRRIAQTMARAATLRWKLHIKICTSPSHSMLTPGQPTPVLTL